MATNTKTHQALAFDLVNEELSRLAALATALEYWTGPKDLSDPDDCLNPTAWRLAQVLSERLDGLEFMKTLRGLMGLDDNASEAQL